MLLELRKTISFFVVSHHVNFIKYKRMIVRVMWKFTGHVTVMSIVFKVIESQSTVGIKINSM